VPFFLQLIMYSVICLIKADYCSYCMCIRTFNFSSAVRWHCSRACFVCKKVRQGCLSYKCGPYTYYWAKNSNFEPCKVYVCLSRKSYGAPFPILHALIRSTGCEEGISEYAASPIRKCISTHGAILLQRPLCWPELRVK
jgi:hypothetical protein